MRLARQIGVIAVFTLPSVVLWWRAWSDGADSTVRCACLDPGQQVWFLAWPAYALRHGLNPVFSTWLWSPHGVNLLSNASATLAGLVLAPVTWAFGPFVTTTVAFTLAPGLSAWGCWLACRRFVSWSPACWVAGLLFGYSPFIVQSVAQGHLTGGLLVIPPLIVVVLHEILVRRERSPWWCGVALGVLVSLQFFISQEYLAMTAMAVAVGLVAAAVMAPRRARQALPFALRAFALAAVVTAVLLAAPVWYMLNGPQTIKGALWSGTQIFAVSMLYQLWSAGPYREPLSSFPSASGIGPPLGFVGSGVLVAAGVSLVVAWRRRVAWVVATVAIVITACSWGGAIFLSQRHLVTAGWLPWPRFWYKPILDDILPVHFAVLADLAAALLIGIGLGAAASWSFWRKVPSAARLVVLGLAAIAMLTPVWVTYRAPLVVQKVVLPPWFATAAPHVAAGSVVVTYPFPASSDLTAQPLVWQAADAMRFRLAGGYVKVPGPGPGPGHGVIGFGPPNSAIRTLEDLTLAGGTLNLTAVQLGHLRTALSQWRTTYIVVTDTGRAPVEAAALFTAATARMPRVVHRAWVWHVAPRSARAATGAQPATSGAAPVATPADVTVAAAAFRSCQARPPPAGAVASDQALPQTLNACIVAGSGAAGSPAAG
jgi:hypothetical protein